jgi:hypothetical protein
LRTLEEAEKFAPVISNLVRQLALLERYERRILSQRRKPFRSCEAARRKSNSSKNWPQIEKANNPKNPA